ncbi:histidine phosphatase family protein [Streptomyces sp. NBC_00474]|uniref:histidine phosphatase family protein n=1 Tax=Streptomyces sp. NBC_00474 TaxID=2975754 RepID=UPI00225B8126|nr:histidine phosphatase family protein [Streptomyces sp. NBC_00474]MCX5053211.1 histidine phosphatase family protein [Streptomyces sp. NBC_00474]
MDTIFDAHPGGRVAVVCHGGITNTYLATVLGLPTMFWFHPGARPSAGCGACPAAGSFCTR